MPALRRLWPRATPRLGRGTWWRTAACPGRGSIWACSATSRTRRDGRLRRDTAARLARASPADAPGDQPQVVLPCTAAVAYAAGANRPDGWRSRRQALPGRDGPPGRSGRRSRSVCRMLRKDWDNAVAVLLGWADDEDLLVVRAAAAAGRRTTAAEAAQTRRSALEIQHRAVDRLHAVPAARRRTEPVQVLRQALGFTVGVAVAATGDFALLTRWPPPVTRTSTGWSARTSRRPGCADGRTRSQAGLEREESCGARRGEAGAGKGYGRTTTILAWTEVRDSLSRPSSTGSPPTGPAAARIWCRSTGCGSTMSGTTAAARRPRTAGGVTADPYATMHLPDPWTVVVVEGEVRPAEPAPELARRLADTANEKYAEYGMDNDPSFYAGALGLSTPGDRLDLVPQELHPLHLPHRPLGVHRSLFPFLWTTRTGIGSAFVHSRGKSDR